MMLDWNGYREQLLQGIARLGRLSPGTVRGYRELIAIAVGVTRQCDGCITTHVHNAGAALVFSARAMDAVAASADG